MIKDDSIFLNHISNSIEEIEKNISNISFIEFNENVSTQDAVIRRLEIIGEAIRNLSDETKQKYPQIPWRDIMDTRNKLIHDYFGVDINLVWEMANKDIPSLKIEIEKILKTL